MHADAAAAAPFSIPVQQPEFALGDTEMLLTDQGRSGKESGTLSESGSEVRGATSWTAVLWARLRSNA